MLRLEDDGENPAQFPICANCGFILAFCGRVYSFPIRTRHAAHVTFIVAELSYRSLLECTTAWPDRVVDESLAVPYGTTSDKTRCTKRDDGSFSSDALGPIDVGIKCHRSAGTSGGFNFALIAARGVSVQGICFELSSSPGRVIHIYFAQTW